MVRRTPPTVERLPAGWKRRAAAGHVDQQGAPAVALDHTKLKAASDAAIPYIACLRCDRRDDAMRNAYPPTKATWKKTRHVIQPLPRPECGVKTFPMKGCIERAKALKTMPCRRPLILHVYVR